MDIIQRNNVHIKGHGTQTMVFAHGFGCDQHMWRWIVPAFEQQYKIVLFDHVGAGQSALSAYDPIKYDSLQGYADDILEICETLSLDKPILVGHSVSAIICILAAIKMPNYFDKLILVAPSPCYINQNGYTGGFSRKDIEGLLDSMDQNYLGWSSQMAPVIMNNQDKPQLGEELTNSFCRTDPDIARHFARVTFLSDNRTELPLVSVPTLTIQCSQDVIAPLPVGEYMHQQLPHDTLTILEATGHCPHMSAPQETIQAIQNFLTVNS